MASIFISMAAYCEPHLQLTLDSAFQTARWPDRLHVGLVDQSIDATHDWLQTRAYHSQVSHLQIDPVKSRGVSWARALAMSLFQQEDYYLQVDSHTLFRQHWDEELIGLHQHVSQHFSKPVLSCYPPGFVVDEQGVATRKVIPGADVFSTVVKPGSTLQPNCATLAFSTKMLTGPDVVPGFHLSGGFLFACGQFVDDVPYDPFMYFHGEEQNLSLRAWTRGYTPVHLRHDWIGLAHLYKSAGQANASHHWNQQHEALRQRKWVQRNADSDARLLRLIRGQLPGSYGLGSARTLEHFCQVSGIDYLRYV